MAPSWASSSSGSFSDSLMARRPSAGLAAWPWRSARAAASLSPPTSRVRTVIGRPSRRAHEGAQGLVLLLLVRQVGAVHIEELGAQQADAFGARGDGELGLARQLHIGQQRHGGAVAGDGGQAAQAGELALGALELHPPLAIGG